MNILRNKYGFRRKNYQFIFSCRWHLEYNYVLWDISIWSFPIGCQFPHVDHVENAVASVNSGSYFGTNFSLPQDFHLSKWKYCLSIVRDAKRMSPKNPIFYVILMGSLTANVMQSHTFEKQDFHFGIHALPRISLKVFSQTKILAGNIENSLAQLHVPRG